MKILQRLAVTAAAMLLVLSQPALGDDFRIETKLFDGSGKKPLSTNTTLFDAGYVYDYLFIGDRHTNPYRVTIFDQGHGRFVVLDPARKVKAEVKADEVRLFAETCQSMAAKSSRPLMKFAAEPAFEVDFDEDGMLTLSSEFINYRLQTEPAGSAESAQQYRDFSDWYARFNSMSAPGSLPPFARMAVDDELARRGLVPVEVHLAIPSKSVSMRSEHHVTWRLLPKDHKLIAETGHELATFKLVTFDKFQAPEQAKK